MSRRLCYCNKRRFYLTGWLWRVCISMCRTIPLLWRGGRHKHFVMHAFSNHVEVLHSVTPIVLLQQTAVLSDGVVVACLYKYVPDHSSPVEGWQAPPDGVLWHVCISMCQTIPLLWRGGRHKHFVMHAFSNHVEVLHSVTPIVLLQQTAVLSDGAVVACLYKYVPDHSPPVEGWQA